MVMGRSQYTRNTNHQPTRWPAGRTKHGVSRGITRQVNVPWAPTCRVCLLPRFSPPSLQPQHPGCFSLVEGRRVVRRPDLLVSFSFSPSPSSRSSSSIHPSIHPFSLSFLFVSCWLTTFLLSIGGPPAVRAYRSLSVWVDSNARCTLVNSLQLVFCARSSTAGCLFPSIHRDNHQSAEPAVKNRSFFLPLPLFLTHTHSLFPSSFSRTGCGTINRVFVEEPTPPSSNVPATIGHDNRRKRRRRTKKTIKDTLS